jgi:hypothetical protein
LRLDESLKIGSDERGLVFTNCFKNSFLHRGVVGRGTFDYCLNPNFTTFANTFIRSESKQTSTGLLTTMFLLNICDRLDLYGFDFASGAPEHANHYYDQRKLRTKTHNFAREKYIIHHLHNIDALKLNLIER